MSKIPEWITDTTKLHSQIFDDEAFNPEYFLHLNNFTKACLGPNARPVELISTFKQSSFTAYHENESVVFFDLSQSFLIKNLFRFIALGDDFYSLAQVLQLAGCTFIMERDQKYSTLIFTCPILESDWYRQLDNDKVQKYSTIISKYRKAFSAPFFSKAIDHYILGHEIFHLLKENDRVETDYKNGSSGLFDYALQQCCYENNSDFKNIATYYGQFPISDEGLENIRKDLVVRRRHYLSTRAHLTEEIECDLFSFQMMLDYLYGANLKNLVEQIDFCKLFYFMFHIFDIHYAMTRRFLLSTESSIDALKPGDIADMNFRAVALGEGMISHLLKRNKLDQNAKKAEMATVYNEYRQSMFELKSAIGALISMPVTRVIKVLLSNAEKIRASNPKLPVQQSDFNDMLDRMKSNQFFNLDDVEEALKR